MRYDIVKIDFPFISDKMSGKGVDRYCYTLSKGFEVLGLQFININGTNFKSYFSSHYKPLPDKMKEIRKIDGKVYHATTPFAWMLPYLTFKKRIVTTVHDIVPFFSNKNKLGINRRIASVLYA